MVVSGNRIAVEVKEMLPRARGPALIFGHFAALLSRPEPICYMRVAQAGPLAGFIQHAVVAELVDALA